MEPSRKFTYKVVKMSEMESKVKPLKCVNEPFSSEKYEGFRVFSSEHIFRSTYHRSHLPEDHFFLAFNGKQVVGVCLLQKSPYGEKDWWISYIDVHKAYKRQGIAKGLYHAINNWVTPDLIIYGSMLCWDGKDANLYEVRRKIITRCQNFSTAEAYYESLQKVESH